MTDRIFLAMHPNKVPYGDTFYSVSFFRGNQWGAWGEPINPIGYRGLIEVIGDAIPEDKPAYKYSAGELLTVGTYRLRVVEYLQWQDALVCAWDTPLGWLQITRARVRFARDWFVHRLF